MTVWRRLWPLIVADLADINILIDLEPQFPFAVAWPLIRGLPRSPFTRVGQHFAAKLNDEGGAPRDE